MKIIATFSIIILTSLTLISCHKHALRGGGSTGSETRELASFTNVEANGSTDIEIYPSTSNRVVITGYENLIPAYETDVRGNTLHLEFKREYYNVMNNNIKITLYTTDMNAVSVNGSGKVYIYPHL